MHDWSLHVEGISIPLQERLMMQFGVAWWGSEKKSILTRAISRLFSSPWL